ncbi:MAG: hypothetical protein ACOCRX_03310 [Candidatus Woesearchaeota archaeon]
MDRIRIKKKQGKKIVECLKREIEIKKKIIEKISTDTIEEKLMIIEIETEIEKLKKIKDKFGRIN